MDSRQDTLSKRKLLMRSDAVIGDDDSKPTYTHESDSFNKDSSKESYTDSMGVDILNFIEATLHKNSKDREFLLETEKKVKDFLADDCQSFLIFPTLSSYNRMLVHRIAAFFGLLHNVDQSGQKVVVTKYSGKTRMPDIEFASLIKHSNFHDSYASRRNVQSFDETRPKRYPSMREFRTKFSRTASEGGNGGELVRGRRARSFEMGDYWFGGGTAHFHQSPQFPPISSVNRQYSDFGGERVGSNCSSNASSSAVQSLHLPIVQQTQQCGQYSSTETSMVSPSSAYSEPANQVRPSPQGHLNKAHYNNGGASSDAATSSTKDPNDHPCSARSNIPSLFAVHPNPPFYSQAYYPMSSYQVVQPNVFSPSSQSPVPIQNYYSAAQIYCPNSSFPLYYPYQNSFVQPHPLLEDNETQQLAEQLGAVGLNSGGETSKGTNGQSVVEAGQRAENSTPKLQKDQQQKAAIAINQNESQ